MKKILVSVLVAILSFAIFSFGFGEEIELNTISGPDVDFLLKRVQQFQDKTGIRVNITVVPYGRDQNIKLMSSFLAGDPSMIFM